jgi:hypothetical protein
MKLASLGCRTCGDVVGVVSGIGMCLGWCRCTYGCSGMCLGGWCREGPPEGTIPAKSLPRKHHVAIKPTHAATVARGVVPQRVDWRLGKEWSGYALREAEWGVRTPFTLHPAPLPPRSPQVVMIYSADCAWHLLPIRCTHRPRLAPRVLRRAELCAEPLSSLPAVLKSQMLFSVGSSSRIRFAVGGKRQGFEQSIKD